MHDKNLDEIPHSLDLEDFTNFCGGDRRAQEAANSLKKRKKGYRKKD